MAAIAWVTCPHCKGEFYCKIDDFEDSNHPLFCPYCNKNFLYKESVRIKK